MSRWAMPAPMAMPVAYGMRAWASIHTMPQAIPKVTVWYCDRAIHQR